MPTARVYLCSLFALFVIPQLFQPATCEAGKVTVKGVHMCCGGCQTIAEDALSDLEGVDEVVCDLNTKAIEFQASSSKAATLGIKSLAAAGFFGKADHASTPLPFPASGAKKGLKANTVLLTGIHLCCTACVTASHKALTGVKGVTVIDIDRNAKSIKLTGDGLDTQEVVDALNRAGFYGLVSKKAESRSR